MKSSSVTPTSLPKSTTVYYGAYIGTSWTAWKKKPKLHQKTKQNAVNVYYNMILYTAIAVANEAVYSPREMCFSFVPRARLAPAVAHAHAPAISPAPNNARATTTVLMKNWLLNFCRTTPKWGDK